MTRSKSVSKLLSLCLITALLWGAVCGYKAFLGPGLTDAAAAAIDLGTLTPTDIVPNNSSIVFSNTNYTDQYKNILFVVNINRSDVQTASFNMYYSSEDEEGWSSRDMELYKFDYGDISYSAGDSVFQMNLSANSGNIYGTITAEHDFSAGERLLTMHFLADSSISTATLLSFFTLSSVTATSTAGASINNAISMAAVVLGDIDCDGAISTLDIGMIEMYISYPNICPLSDSQKIAADVNMDGVIDNTDVALVTQYSAETISGFLEVEAARTTEPTTYTATIISGRTYRLKNARTGQYLKMSNVADTAGIEVSDTDINSVLAKFKVTENTSGTKKTYFIESVFHGKKLWLNGPDWRPTVDTSFSMLNSDEWYIVPVAGGYRIMNRAMNFQKGLSDFGYAKTTMPDCGMSYLDGGDVWILEGPKITLSYHYDKAYYTRYSAAGVADLAAKQERIGTILTNVFSLDVTLEEPGDTPITSFGDECASGINEYCRHNTCDSNRTEDTCKANCRSVPYTNVHHKNANATLLKFNAALAGAGPNNNTINVLFTGNKHCYVNASKEHKENGVAGLAYCYSSHRVSGVFVDNIGNRPVYEKITALHEISHQLGAYGNGSVADSVHHTDENGRGLCVMSYNRDNSTLLMWFDSDFPSDHRRLYCDSCYNEIMDYLNLYS